jgi:hypothetical protein
MQRAKASKPLSVCCDADGVAWPPFGSSCRHAFSAAWNWELLTPSSWGATLGNPLGVSLLLVGSGNFATPWERMHCEKASAFWELPDCGFAGPPAFEDGLLCVVDEPTCAT